MSQSRLPSGRSRRALAAAVAAALGISSVSVVATAAPALADEGPGCTLSGYHAVAGDFVTGPTFATITYGAASRTVDPSNANYHIVSQGSTVRNTSAAHAYYDARWLIGHSVLQEGNSAVRYTTLYDGSSTFVSQVAPTSATWVPRDPAHPRATFRPSSNAVLTVGTMVYGSVPGVPTNGTLFGAAVTVDPSAAVPAYQLGTIAVGAVLPTRVSAVVDRPTSNASFGWATTDLIAVRTCLPDPTVASWISGSGVTPITGTGDYAGDVIEVRDGGGALIGTTTVQPDLTWSLVPATPLPSGTTSVIATEIDEFGLTGASAAGTLRVVSPDATVTKLLDEIDVTGAPGPERLVGAALSWRFVVANTGDVDLRIDSLVDVPSTATPIDVTCDELVVDAGSSVSCTASSTAESGAVSDTATLTATAVDEDGAPVQDTAAVVREDSSWYQGVTAGISITKTADRASVSAAGQRIDYAFVVRNTGTGTLSGIVVRDRFEGRDEDLPVSCPATVLAAGDEMTCTARYDVAAGDLRSSALTNRATAEGVVAGADIASPSVTASVAVAVPPLAGTGSASPAPAALAALALILLGLGAGIRRRRS